MKDERRTIQENIENYIETHEIIVLTGMRRVGKITLMNMIFKKAALWSRIVFGWRYTCQSLEDPTESD